MATQRAEALLEFLTGDLWTLNPLPETTHFEGVPSEPLEYSRVALLSGGLDSFAHAAALTPVEREQTLFVGYRENPATAHAQAEVVRWFDEREAPIRLASMYVVRQPSGRQDTLSRSRALLFAALGIAAASVRGLASVVIPENGYTSLNPPLLQSRSGVYSTRSTHPKTLDDLNALLGEIGIETRVANPYAWETKGELVARAALQQGDGFADGIAFTHSCAKMDTFRLKGGNPNWNCGACVACIVRRASVAAAGLADSTPYALERLKATPKETLIRRRSPDLRAVQRALLLGPDEDELIASCPFPAQYDFDRAIDLWGRALDEIGALALPAPIP